MKQETESKLNELIEFLASNVPPLKARNAQDAVSALFVRLANLEIKVLVLDSCLSVFTRNMTEGEETALRDTIDSFVAGMKKKQSEKHILSPNKTLIVPK